MEGCCGVWGRSPQPPEANGGLGANHPAAEGWGSNPRRQKNRQFLRFFNKNNVFLGIFRLKFLL